MFDLLYSPMPPPLVVMPDTDGATSTTVDQLPVSGVDSSMKWLEITDCGWVSVSGAFVGALAAAFLDSAVTMTVVSSAPSEPSPAAAVLLVAWAKAAWLAVAPRRSVVESRRRRVLRARTVM